MDADHVSGWFHFDWHRNHHHRLRTQRQHLLFYGDQCSGRGVSQFGHRGHQCAACYPCHTGRHYRHCIGMPGLIKYLQHIGRSGSNILYMDLAVRLDRQFNHNLNCCNRRSNRWECFRDGNQCMRYKQCQHAERIHDFSTGSARRYYRLNISMPGIIQHF